MESCSRIKHRDGRLAQGKDEVGRIWKEYFEDLYNVDTRELRNMYGFEGIWRGNYFGGDPIGKAEVEVSVGKLKNGKATAKDEIAGGIIKGEGDRVVDWTWRLCNMAFESGVVPEDLRSAVIVPLYKGKGERNKCKNYKKYNRVNKEALWQVLRI